MTGRELGDGVADAPVARPRADHQDRAGLVAGADGVFVGSGIFKSGDPERRAKAIVEATTHYRDAEILARVSAGLGEPMVGISTQSLDPSELLETRGW